jgi:predicted phosphoadenosine phosphosulfate sulfurtransferase
MVQRSYLQESVYEAAVKRFNWLFDEFENIMVCVSGGKDSTVCLNMALQIATERDRLPLTVQFTDQEAEWQTVIDHMRKIMGDDRVDPHWLQVPIKLFNASSQIDPWLQCWEPGMEWIREKEPNSIHKNEFDTDRFHNLFAAYAKYVYGDEPACMISGVRCEESPARVRGLTGQETYKGETWGKRLSKRVPHFTMYPIYDWSYTDVWKAIHDNGWPYCPIYDYQYQHGISVIKMRVSNVHHETAISNLFYLQEIEAETWNRITARLSGISTAGQMQTDILCPKTLPPMFRDWFDYRDHLIKYLVTDPEKQDYYRRTFARYDERYPVELHKILVKIQISSVLTNDTEGIKLGSFRGANFGQSKNVGKKSKFLVPLDEYREKQA